MRNNAKISLAEGAGHMHKKWIAVISTGKFPGTSGDTSNYSELINQLTREGFQVLLICPKNPDAQHHDLGLSMDVKIIRIPYQPPTHKHEITNHVKPKHYLELLMFLLVESITVFWALKNKKIRYAITRHTVHTMQLPILFRLLGIRSIADGELMSDSLKGKTNPIFFHIVKSYEKKVIKFYTFLKASSHSHAENLQKFGFPNERILVIPIAIDVEKVPKFSIEEIPAHTFGYFGVLEEWQGLDILLKAFELLHKKIPNAKLYIIGKGSLEVKLKETVTRNNLSSHVIFTTVSREKLWNEYFRKFRVVVIPRPRRNDSTDKILPIKLVESLASGKPTIVMDIPIMREIPENSVYIVPAEDPESLAHAMETLSMNNEIMVKYAQAALVSATNYDIRTKTKQLVAALIGDNNP